MAAIFQYSRRTKIGVAGAILILFVAEYWTLGLQNNRGISIHSRIRMYPRREDLVLRLDKSLEVNCNSIFEGNISEITKIKSSLVLVSQISDEHFLEQTRNCTWVEDYFRNGFCSTTIEKSFPIAFSLLIHNGTQQVIRLMKLLYRPHSQYCIAPDLKSSAAFLNIFRNIAKCLDNVHVVSELLAVRWGHKSIIQSQMQCYKDLLKIREKQTERTKWKYVVNICGKELPLNSNHDIVAHLAELNGSSSIEARKILHTDGTMYSRLKGKTIPYSLPLYKSMTYMSLSFDFVHFLFTNSTAVQLYKYFLGCEIPEEHYYATVYMIPGVPGGYNPHIAKEKRFKTDNYFWRNKYFVKKYGRQCNGLIVHDICVVDIGDLSSIMEATNDGRNALFHNKYFMEYDSVIMDCMEKRIEYKNKLEYARDHHSLNIP